MTTRRALLPRWGISVLAEHHRADIARLSRPAPARFDGVTDWATSDGAVLLDRATAPFRVGVETEMAAGDHVLTLLYVHALHRSAESAPLVFYGNRLHDLAAAREIGSTGRDRGPAPGTVAADGGVL